MQVVRERDRCDKSVAPSRSGREIPGATLAVAERSAQRRNLDLEITFLDVGMRPDAGDQVILGNELARPIEQCKEDIEGAAAQANGLARVQQQPLCRQQGKGPNKIAREAGSSMRSALVDQSWSIRRFSQWRSDSREGRQ